MKKTGLAYIVQFRRQTAPSGGLSKNSPLPHALIWGLTPNFKIVLRVSRTPTNPENFERKSQPIFEKFFGENLHFRGLGELLSISEFKKYSSIVFPIGGPNLVALRFWADTFFREKPFSHCRQWKGRLITCPLSAGKTLTTESVDVGAIYS